MSLFDSRSWFVVLADSDACQVLSRQLRPVAARVVSHASGRPWLMGCWDDSRATVVEAGPVRIALLGYSSATVETLRRFVASATDLTAFDRLAGDLDGTFHLLVSQAGQVRAQGSVSGVRRIFHGSFNNIPIASDSSLILASLANASLDQDRLPLYLLRPQLSQAVSAQTPWSGIDVVPPDSYLHLTPHEGAKISRWWRPPPPDLPLADVAPLFGDLLQKAVEGRIGSDEPVSADLSGGLDSTPISALAARATSSLTCVTEVSGNGADDDLPWARRAAAALPGITHIEVHPSELPSMFAGIHQVAHISNDPFTFPVSQSRLEARIRLTTSWGCRLHFSGLGGDEVLTGNALHLPALLRRHPRTGLRHLHAYRALYHWRWASVMTMLTSRGGFGQELKANLSQVKDPLMSYVAPGKWNASFRLPPWATIRTEKVIEGLITRNLGSIRPFAPTPWQHDHIDGIRNSAQGAARIAESAEPSGLEFVTPLLDDRLIELALSVKPWERRTPFRYKPLMVDAMRGRVPDTILRRRTKPRGAATLHSQRRDKPDELTALCKESVLADYGLIDPYALREAHLGSLPYGVMDSLLTSTLGLEQWLRCVLAHPELRKG